MSLEKILHEVRELRMQFQQNNSAPQIAEPTALGSHSCSICGSPWHPSACCPNYQREAYDHYQPRPQYPDYYPITHQRQQFQGYSPMVQQSHQVQDPYSQPNHHNWSGSMNSGWQNSAENYHSLEFQPTPSCEPSGYNMESRQHSTYSHIPILKSILCDITELADRLFIYLLHTSFPNFSAKMYISNLIEDLMLIQNALKSYMGSRSHYVEENMDEINSLLRSCVKGGAKSIVARARDALEEFQVAEYELKMQVPHSTQIVHVDSSKEEQAETSMANSAAVQHDSEPDFAEPEHQSDLLRNENSVEGVQETKVEIQGMAEQESEAKPLDPWMIWTSESEDESEDAAESELSHESAPFEVKAENSDDDQWEQASSTSEDDTSIDEELFKPKFFVFCEGATSSPCDTLLPGPESFIATPAEFFLDRYQSLAAQSTLELDIIKGQVDFPLADSFACNHVSLESDLSNESILLANKSEVPLPPLSYLEDFPATELDLKMLESDLKNAKLEPYLEEPHMDIHMDFPAADLDDFEGYIEPFLVKTEAVQIWENPEITPTAINTELGLFCASNSLEIDCASSVLPAMTSATLSEHIFKVAQLQETTPAILPYSDTTDCWIKVSLDFHGALSKKAAPRGNILAFSHLLQLLNIDSPWIHLVKYMPRHTRILREWCKTKEFKGSQPCFQLYDEHDSKIFFSLTDDELEIHIAHTSTTEFFRNDLLWKNFQASTKPP